MDDMYGVGELARDLHDRIECPSYGTASVHAAERITMHAAK
jgi:hypothetical protein